MNDPIQTYVTKCVALYKKQKPDWHPPHGLAFKVAERLKFTDVRVNGRTHEFYKKNARKLFDGDLMPNWLEGPIIITCKNKEGTKLQVRFLWLGTNKIRLSGSVKRL